MTLKYIEVSGNIGTDLIELLSQFAVFYCISNYMAGDLLVGGGGGVAKEKSEKNFIALLSSLSDQ